MYVKRKYGFWMTLNWSKQPFIYGILYAVSIETLAFVLDLGIELPWQPIGVLGIAVAFYLGFKNNSSYDRTWEARKIWGSIVNNSRTFAAAVIAFSKGPEQSMVQREMIYRHLAWLTTLRHQLRLSRTWEHTEDRLNGLYVPTICEDYNTRLDAELLEFIGREELVDIESKSNRATQILLKQSKRLQELKDQGYIEDFRHMELHNLIRAFYEDQGKSERIKNFPFPRQYASVAFWLSMVFCALLPFGLISIFQESFETAYLWICPLMSGLLTWVFFLMEMIGDYSENPFEGTYNDVPITSIARAIEIDLREMINDQNIPNPIEPENGFLM
jgi:putative membrane protein